MSIMTDVPGRNLDDDDVRSFLEQNFTIQCPTCHQQYCWMYGEDSMPTTLACGHMMCFKVSDEL